MSHVTSKYLGWSVSPSEGQFTAEAPQPRWPVRSGQTEVRGGEGGGPGLPAAIPTERSSCGSRGFSPGCTAAGSLEESPLAVQAGSPGHGSTCSRPLLPALLAKSGESTSKPSALSTQPS